MKFQIFTTTAGTRVGELANELRRLMEDKINAKYAEFNSDIGIVIRTLPDSLNKKSFTRYMDRENDMTIDFCISLESYEKLYKIEQKFELGKTFLAWLDKGLSNKKFLKNNPGFDKDGFIAYIISLGRETDWFADEVDYSRELDYSWEYWECKWLKNQ